MRQYDKFIYSNIQNLSFRILVLSDLLRRESSHDFKVWILQEANRLQTVVLLLLDSEGR